MLTIPDPTAASGYVVTLGGDNNTRVTIRLFYFMSMDVFHDEGHNSTIGSIHEDCHHSQYWHNI